MELCKLLLIVLSTIFTNQIGTDVQLDDVFCFTNFLSGFLFRVRGRVRVRVRARGGFRVRVRVRTSVGG